MNNRKSHHRASTSLVPTNNTTAAAAPHYLHHFLWLSLVATCVKLLLIPAYRSTDFEVHRNWLAVTHSLPLSEWYSDETSPWTLDYPPFFAYFERLLSIFAALLDPTMADLTDGLNYASDLAVIFQRLSVVVSDAVLFLGVYGITRRIEPKGRSLIWVLVVGAPGLVIVDHMHFQYNGFLLGVLLLSLAAVEEGRDLMGGFLFAVLLCFKHLFAVAAPVFFVYLLRHYCRGGLVKGIGRLVMMGSVVVAVFAAAYGPFLYYGQIQQVLRRMFPFDRGLCHAYWAPNFWVFYIMLDKVLRYLLVKLGFNIQVPTASFTGGLVGDSSPFAILPSITPAITLIMVLLSLSPCLVKAWRDPRPKMITRWVSYAYTCGFMFGWHVHEKASLHFVIPLAITATRSAEDARHYFILLIVSCYSLFPLLYEAQEYPIKVILLLLHASLMWHGFSSNFMTASSAATPGRNNKNGRSAITKNEEFVIGRVGKCYLVGLLKVEIWGQFLHPLILGDELPFLPIMLISVYCGFGMIYSWIWQLKQIVGSL